MYGLESLLTGVWENDENFEVPERQLINPSALLRDQRNGSQLNLLAPCTSSTQQLLTSGFIQLESHGVGAYNTLFLFLCRMSFIKLSLHFVTPASSPSLSVSQASPFLSLLFKATFTPIISYALFAIGDSSRRYVHSGKLLPRFSWVESHSYHSHLLLHTSLYLQEYQSLSSLPSSATDTTHPHRIAKRDAGLAGGGVGGFLSFLILIWIIWCCIRRRRTVYVADTTQQTAVATSSNNEAAQATATANNITVNPVFMVASPQPAQQPLSPQPTGYGPAQPLSPQTTGGYPVQGEIPMTTLPVQQPIQAYTGAVATAGGVPAQAPVSVGSPAPQGYQQFQQHSVQSAPIQTAPIQTAPIQAAPIQTAPIQQGQDGPPPHDRVMWMKDDIGFVELLRSIVIRLNIPLINNRFLSKLRPLLYTLCNVWAIVYAPFHLSNFPIISPSHKAYWPLVQMERTMAMAKGIYTVLPSAVPLFLHVFSSESPRTPICL
ncbi:uncharacterized protein BDR25DRAFT_353025 [Lindgomyces ingoldianus]|uniref:Uncharacterized protein n=1 Tax=Lindgomyces ingoldianus TaxID=673940 RepID=A0ACB6R0N8_9PLEO|nr:uncharacterized protein BDR25DRAFT_353025 [Lindgomyces ingoldianus]KAF2472706.1 hypothetical protein BDR25DRAFT_353025 [Lindgomyces ingoldianus]